MAVLSYHPSASSETTLYERLKVSPNAPLAVIRAAYRVLASMHHPDRQPGQTAAVEMVALNTAYAVLSDPTQRQRYDHELRAARRLPTLLRFRQVAVPWAETQPFDAAAPVHAAHTAYAGMPQQEQEERRHARQEQASRRRRGWTLLATCAGGLPMLAVAAWQLSQPDDLMVYRAWAAQQPAVTASPTTPGAPEPAQEALALAEPAEGEPAAEPSSAADPASLSHSTGLDLRLALSLQPNAR